MSDSFDVSKDSQRKENFKKRWGANHNSVLATQSLEKTIQSIQTLENNSIFSNGVIVVYSVQDFKPLYVSKNVEKIIGYTQEEFIGWKESAFLKIGGYDQPSYYPDLLKWEKHFTVNCPVTTTPTKIRGHYCGVQYLRKDGTTRRFMLCQEFVLRENFTFPEFDLLYFEEVCHLIKGDDYWMLFESSGEAGSFSKFYRKEGIDNNLITPREKEVLNLIAKGKSTKGVAAELHISPETVGQHRKNMIKKTMAKDTSALIQLCKICKII